MADRDFDATLDGWGCLGCLLMLASAVLVVLVLVWFFKAVNGLFPT